MGPPPAASGHKRLAQRGRGALALDAEPPSRRAAQRETVAGGGREGRRGSAAPRAAWRRDGGGRGHLRPLRPRHG